MKENLSAPGELTQWFDGCIYALKKGDFTNIEVTSGRHRITANYGADRLGVSLYQKDAKHVYLSIESTAAEVLGWFKSCVTRVMLHPQQGFHEGLSQSVYNANNASRQQSGKQRPLTRRKKTPRETAAPSAADEPTRAFNPYEAAKAQHAARTQAWEPSGEREQAISDQPDVDDTLFTAADNAEFDDSRNLFETQPLPEDQMDDSDAADVSAYDAAYDDAYQSDAADDAAYDYVDNVYQEPEPQTFREKFDALCGKNWFILVMVLVVAPFGIYLLWRHHPKKTFARIMATIGAVAYFLFIWLGFLGVNTGINRQTFTNLRNQRTQQTQSNVNKTPDSTSSDSSSTDSSTDSTSSDSTDDSSTDSDSSNVLGQMMTNIQNNLANMFGGSSAQ